MLISQRALLVVRVYYIISKTIFVYETSKTCESQKIFAGIVYVFSKVGFCSSSLHLLHYFSLYIELLFGTTQS